MKHMTWKRTFSALLAFILVMLSIPMTAVEADAATSGYYTYTVTDGEVTITDVDESISGDVVIPDTLGEYPVTSIGDEAFYNCNSLTSVTIPDSVIRIGASAFYNCTSLTSVTIPDNITRIGNWAFRDCKNLTSISISDNAIMIGQYAFYNTGYYNNLWNWTNDVLYIGNHLIHAKDTISGNYTIKEGTITIACGAFYKNTSLVKIMIPDSVTTVGSLAFSSCTSLLNVSIGNSVTMIYGSTFAGCQKLQSVIIGNNVTRIVDSAFYNCSNLTSITIPDSMTSVGDGSFSRCTSLTNIYYSGSKTQWNNILIEPGNECLTGAMIHYNSTFSKPEKSIAVFTTEKSLSVKTGDSMWLAFGLLNNNDELDDEWTKMAIVVSNPTVISLSDYKETEYGYSLEVVGKKEGSTNVTITDTETGINTIIVISVYDSFIQTHSYAIDDMQMFYPNNPWEDHVATNIYNLNGLYVNNYNCIKKGNKYNVSFDVYNERYHTGAIDVYDADGNWLGSEIIEKYSNITSLWDTGEQVFYMFTDFQWMSYTHAMHSKKSSVNFEVPDGGYFTISNNFVESPGCFLYNACEIFYEGVSATIDIVADNVETPFVDLIMGEINDNKATRDLFFEIFISAADEEIREYSENILNGNLDSAYAGISGMLENMLHSLEIEWEHLFKTAAGIGESAFEKLSGPAGLALQGCFGLSEASNKYLQAVHLASSTDEVYASVYSYVNEGFINSNGIVVNTRGNIDTKAALQVFRISKDNTIEIVLDKENPLEKYELYNICFVKDDQLVQPNDKVTVRIPVPVGMNSNTCKIYRQESDSSWTILEAHIEGNYLVFETDHFSLYAVIGDSAELSVVSLPNQISYTEGDVLNTEGLVLSINGKQISHGFICDPTVLFGSGAQIITVKYGCTSTGFSVDVNEYTSTPGDANSDGKINLTDVSIILKYIAKWDITLDEEAADVNNDSKINLTDVSLILKYIAKWDVELV